MDLSPFGTEIIADFYGVNEDLLKDANLLNKIFRKAITDNNFTIIKHHSFKFLSDGEGVTGVFLLSESHATYHTYPEWGTIAINIFSCGKSRPKTTLNYLTTRLKPIKIQQSIIKRNFNSSLTNNSHGHLKK